MGIFDWFRPRPPPAHAVASPSDLLSRPVHWFTDCDPFTLADACEGVAIFGGVGSGKTSGSGRALALSYLRLGFGGLVLCAKADEAAQWERYAAETGRTGDLLIVREGGAHAFNFLDYEANAAGKPEDAIENLIQLFTKAATSGTRAKDGGDSAAFWQQQMEDLLRNALYLITFAGEPVSLLALSRIIASAPQNPEQSGSAAWWDSSECGRLIALAEQRTEEGGDEGAKLDFQQMHDYWLMSFPNLADKTRSIIVATFAGIASPLLRGTMRRLFCERTTLTPEDSFRGKIIVLDIPQATRHETGIYAQVLFKLCWQRAAGKRVSSGNPFPAFLWADEAQYFLSQHDAQFFTTARASRILPVILSQNLPNFYAAFGGNKDAVHSLMGNLITKIWHNNSCITTNEWAAKTIGEAWAEQVSVNVSDNRPTRGDTGSDSSGASLSQHKRFSVEPQAFTMLAKGGQANGLQVEGVVFSSGKRFSQMGACFAVLVFSQA